MRRFLKALAGGVTLCILLSLCGFDGQCQAVRNNVVRLHILANSDTAEDQTLKLKVRDAVTAAERMGVRADVGQVFTSDQFYNDNPEANATYRKFGILAVEMETAGIYWTAQRFGKRALSILTISDHIFTGEALSAQERQDSFHEMMEIALETAWNAAE